MPELPELQAHAERLSDRLTGRRLAEFTPVGFSVLKTAEPLPEAAIDTAVLDVSRRGKYLLVRLETITFVVHLMQGGRLVADPKPSTRGRGVQARWRFDDGATLALVEPGSERRAGVWCVHTERLERSAPLTALGPEALDVTVDDLANAFTINPMRLHNFLRDQRLIAGLGRRLANEICHRARLSPFANTAQLEPDAVGRVQRAIAECCAESLAEERQRDELTNSATRRAAVHGHDGKPCPVCGSTIRAVVYSDYTVSYCPACQTGGRVLADNTTSRFLR